MTEFVVYLILGPVMVLGMCLLVLPVIERARQRKIEKSNRIVQEILDEYTREVELRTKFDIAYNDRRARHKVINVDFVDHGPPTDKAADWKLVYNEELGIYQKVRR